MPQVNEVSWSSSLILLCVFMVMISMVLFENINLSLKSFQISKLFFFKFLF